MALPTQEQSYGMQPGSIDDQQFNQANDVGGMELDKNAQALNTPAMQDAANQQPPIQMQDGMPTQSDLNSKMDMLKVAFDPSKDPKDMQSIQDATSAADALSKMNPEQQQQAWPRIASGLIQDNPKMANMISVDKVPTKEQLDAVLNQNGKSLFPKVENKTTGNESTQEYAYQKLGKTAQNQIQSKIIESDQTLSDLDEIKKHFNPEDFTVKRQALVWAAGHDERLGINSMTQKQHDEYAASNAQLNRIKRLMLIYRKMITGVAGGPDEMKTIENSTLNPRMSASQARAEMGSLQHKYLRDRMAYRNLLTRGIMAENMDSKDYTNLFKSERAKVEADNKQYMRELRAKYPQYKNKIDENFALQHKSYWDAQKFKQHLEQEQGAQQ